jgi:hypothetical protein
MPYLLSNIRRDAAGTIKRGFVENGHWTLTAKRIAPEDIEIAVPDDVDGDYNDVISWAQERLK